jgi:hypothetical protein
LTLKLELGKLFLSLEGRELRPVYRGIELDEQVAFCDVLARSKGDFHDDACGLRCDIDTVNSRQIPYATEMGAPFKALGALGGHRNRIPCHSRRGLWTEIPPSCESSSANPCRHDNR